jgi:tetratricopeptide (TPR) repeat protein
MGVALVCAFGPLAFPHGDVHERIQALSAKIQPQTRDATLFVERAELYRMHEDFALAEADLARAEELDPALASVWLTRGRLRMAQKQFAAAEREADRVLAKAPESGPALVLKAQALREQKHFPESAESWHKALVASKAPDVELFYECASAFAAAGDDRCDEALAVLDEGIKKLGNIPTLALMAIEIEVRRGSHDAALARLDQAMPKQGRVETWIERRADILARAGKPNEARQEYERALNALAVAPERLRMTPAAKKLEERLRSKVAAFGQ